MYFSQVYPQNIPAFGKGSIQGNRIVATIHTVVYSCAHYKWILGVVKQRQFIYIKQRKLNSFQIYFDMIAMNLINIVLFFSQILFIPFESVWI